MSRAVAFSTTYKEGVWGNARDKPFYSGLGSTGEYADRYCNLIENYIHENQITTAVDLGCGDFAIGSRLAKSVGAYCGVDIVPELIEYNIKTFGNDRITFKCIDIVEEALPSAQLCLVRQVFQHLSNSEIATVLKKLKTYEHVVVTEHVPAGPVRVPNKDKTHGPDQRLYDSSGVFLDQPPFSCAVEKSWELPYKEGEKLVISLLKNSPKGASLSASAS